MRIRLSLTIAILTALAITSIYSISQITSTRPLQYQLDFSDLNAAVVTLDVLVPEIHNAKGAINTNQPTLRHSNGSGFFINDQGLLVTNAHVVSGASTIWITSEGKQAIARLVGLDKSMDIAVLDTDIKGNTFLRISNDKPNIGDAVFAIGSPFRFTNSVSSGIVSGVDRAMRNNGPNWFLQHTAPVNPGSSGGPVLNVHGEVIGVNTALPDSQFEFAGIALSINADVISHAIEQIVEKGMLKHVYIGATLRAIDPPLSQLSFIAGTGGLLIENVDPGSPAQIAGLLPDDRIISANGRKLESLSSFVALLEMLTPETRLKLNILRGVDELAIEIQPAELPHEPSVLTQPTTQFGLQFKDGDLQGVVLIASVDAGSIAEEAGLRVGDRVHSIDLIKVVNSREAQAMVNRPTGLILLRLSRDSATTSYVLLGVDRSKSGLYGGNNLGVLSRQM